MIRHVAQRPSRPVLIYDGECGFCRRWIQRWRRATGAGVDYLPSQGREVAERFPEIPAAQFDEAVHLVSIDGSVSRGAEAVLRSLGSSNSGSAARWLRWYQRFPWFAAVVDWGYRFVARNRSWLSKLF
ncbi:MAG TPA: DCC1-like thiol-disulfide oxidoreductase family protein [Verrucomicrobiae bacterium]|nr:DCC1-like thiol-disulfide oxidoreductase family protein [Verrucomicrobiae bacterium]